MKSINDAAKVMYDDAKNIGAFINGAEFAQRWIPIEEELPPCSDDDLLLKGVGHGGIVGIVDIGYMHDSNDGKPHQSNFMSHSGVLIAITHWRPIDRY